MTEQILRLIRDKKIVGYMTIWWGNILYVSIPRFIRTHETDMVISKPVFDSFNLGFQFGDKWIFEGDKVTIYLGERRWKGKIVLETLTWWLVTIDNYYCGIAEVFDEIKSITVTGNIYEASHEI